MVGIVGMTPCREVEIERDHYVPLTVSWLPSVQTQPLYLRVSGTSGGEIELKLDPATGQLAKFIVLLMPPRSEDWNMVSYGHLVEEMTVPLFDRSAWTTDAGTIGLPGARPVVEEEMDLSYLQDDDRIVLHFGRLSPVRVLQCQNIAVGIAADSSLATLAVFL